MEGRRGCWPPSLPWACPPAAAAAASNGDGGSGGSAAGQSNAAVGKVFNPSDKKGGTSRSPTPATGTRSTPATPTTATPGTSLRLYGRALTHVQAGPGRGGHRARPGPRRATSARPATAARPGPTSSSKGVKFEDGTADHVQGRQVRRRALARQGRRSRNGPTYFNDFLDLPRATRARTRTKDPDNWPQGDRDAGRPDDRLPPQAAVRRLRLPRPAARRPIPVPQAKDTGAKYKEHVVSTGPYKFDDHTSPARASRWSATPTGTRPTDPNRKALPDEIRGRSSTSTPTTSTTGSSPVTSTSTSRAPASQPAALGQGARRPER